MFARSSRSLIRRASCLLALLLLSLPAAAQTITTTPASPVANASFELNVAGTWPNSCTPRFSSVSVAANRITIEGRANETCSACLTVLRDYSFSSTALTVPAGTYVVDFFVTDCNTRSMKASRNLTVAAPPSIVFSANPQTIDAGASSTLSWTTQNAIATRSAPVRS